MRRALLTPAVTLLLLLALAAAGLATQGDIVIRRKAAGDGTKEIPPAVFPHLPHRIRFKCYVCHESIFKMKAGANPMTMDAMMDGKLCGACHDGKTAFHISFATCNRCHPG